MIYVLSTDITLIKSRSKRLLYAHLHSFIGIISILFSFPEALPMFKRTLVQDFRSSISKLNKMKSKKITVCGKIKMEKTAKGNPENGNSKMEKTANQNQ